MGAELGATTSIFPSDEITKAFLKAQGRKEDWCELQPDSDAVYDEVIDIDLSSLKPMAACPHSPDNIKTIEEIGPQKVDQVCIGSCTNSSYLDLMRVAAILKGKAVHEDVSLSIAPGSKQVYNMLALKRRTRRFDCRRRKDSGMCVRPVHRHGTVAEFQGYLSAYLQPQF